MTITQGLVDPILGHPAISNFTEGMPGADTTKRKAGLF